MFIHEAWQAMVNIYTCLGLTYEKDRLPALARLAEEIQNLQLRKGRYLVDLWEDILVEDLHWYNALSV